MADLIRVGQRLINLEAVAVVELDDDEGVVAIHFTAAAPYAPPPDEDDDEPIEALPTLYMEVFKGAEAAALRRYFSDWRRFPDLMVRPEERETS